MNTWLQDRTISCPHYAKLMNMIIDLSAHGQTYIEDCQIFCKPMQIEFDVSGGELVYLRIARGD